MAGQVAQVQAGVMAQRVHQPPVHLAVKHLEVHTREFRLDSIDVDSLSGERNIGLTSELTAQPAAPEHTPGPPPAAPASKTGDFRVSLVGNRQLYIERPGPEGEPGPFGAHDDHRVVLKRERFSGYCTRSVMLPTSVLPTGARARYEDGILEVYLARQEPGAGESGISLLHVSQE